MHAEELFLRNGADLRTKTRKNTNQTVRCTKAENIDKYSHYNTPRSCTHILIAERDTKSRIENLEFREIYFFNTLQFQDRFA